MNKGFCDGAAIVISLCDIVSEWEKPYSLMNCGKYVEDSTEYTQAVK